MANQKEKLVKELVVLTGLDETVLLTKTLKDLSEMLEEVNSAEAPEEEELPKEEVEAGEEAEQVTTEAPEEELPKEEVEAKVETKKEKNKKEVTAEEVVIKKFVKIVTELRKENHDTRHDVIMLRNVRYLNRVYKQGEVLDNMDVRRYLVKMGYAE